MMSPLSIELAENHWLEQLKDGSHVLIRPLRPEDREREAAFIAGLSAEARHFRFGCSLKEASPALLDHLMQVDYRSTMAFVALTVQEGQPIQVGVARYGATDDEEQCECAVVVADDWRRRGLAAALMRHLIDYARRQGFRQVYSLDAPSNQAVQSLARHLGSTGTRNPEDPGQLIHRLRL
ncbi:Protein lysine acetyltransferase Pat [compost metagenome]